MKKTDACFVVSNSEADLGKGESFRGEFQIRKRKWKNLDHKSSGGKHDDRSPMNSFALTTTHPDAPGHLYDLEKDPGKRTHRYCMAKAKREELPSLLDHLKSSGRSTPRSRSPIGIGRIP